MIFKEIIFNFINNNKKLVLSNILVGSLIQIIKVFLLPYVYSNIINNMDIIEDKLVNVVYVWVILCILFIAKSKLETEIYSSLLFYVRNILYKRYIVNNYYDFNDSNTNIYVQLIVDSSKLCRDLFILISQTLIPTFVLIIGMNIYFLTIFPEVGIINTLSNIFNYMIIKYFQGNILELIDTQQNIYMGIVNKMYETFNNIMDIFLNIKYDDNMNNYIKLESDYKKIHIKLFYTINNLITTLKINNYIFAFISIYTLYKLYDKKYIINNLLIYTFYINQFQELTEQVPRLFISLFNLHYIEKKK